MLEQRISKVIVAFGIAIFAFVVFVNNILDYDLNFEFVRHVLEMDTINERSLLSHRSVRNNFLQTAAFFFIIALEFLVSIMFFIGAFSMWISKSRSQKEFHVAKRFIFIGVALAFILWYIGFLVVAGEWFVMRQSIKWNTLESAFRVISVIILSSLYISQREDGI